MVRIILVRHGQVEWNRQVRFRGRIELDLNATGERQAQAVARRIREDFVVDAVYSSPMRRACQTAQAIAQEVKRPVQVLEGINDLDYGGWQGLSPDEVAGLYPDQYDLWLNRPDQLQFPGGESLIQMRDRAMGAVEDVVSRHEGQTVVLVSHLSVCKILLCALLGLEVSCFWHVEQGNTALNVIRREPGRYVVERMNDTCHLRGLARQ